MSWEFWPQYLMVSLYAFNFGSSLAKYTNTKSDGINVLTTLGGIAVSAFILYSGGFFG